MICEKCGKEYSDPVYEIHKEICNKKNIAENKEKSISKMNKEELLKKAEELGITIGNIEEIKKSEIIDLIEKAKTENTENSEE